MNNFVAAKRWSLEDIHLAIEAGNIADDLQKILSQAARDNQSEVLHIMIRAGVDIGSPLQMDGRSSPLHEAAARGHLDCVELFIREGANVDAINEAKTTPLHFACGNARNNGVECVQALILAGANIDAQGVNDYTPLHWATKIKSVEYINLLLRAGADFRIVDHDKMTPEALVSYLFSKPYYGPPRTIKWEDYEPVLFTLRDARIAHEKSELFKAINQNTPDVSVKRVRM